jgi:uncharacterized protein YydD (DUF2326 family)
VIHHFNSDLGSFKPLTFKPGLNILLADKSAGATDRQSRNGSGKTSFIELVHFMFGADATKGTIFTSSALKKSTFSVTLDINGKILTAFRSGDHPETILLSGEVEQLNIQPLIPLRDGLYELSNKHWKSNLGYLWFGVPIADAKPESFIPSFRSLFSYFVRRQNSGGFQNHEKHSEMQQNWDWQVSLSYLLGLDWNISRQLRELHEQDKMVKTLRKMAKNGGLGHLFNKAADLRTQLAIAEENAARQKKQLEAFEVVPEYQLFEMEASTITCQIDELNVDNLMDTELLQQLHSSLCDVVSTDFKDITKLYREAGIVLSDMIKRRFDELELFHQTAIKNRRIHLENEIASVQDRVEERNRLIMEKDRRRRQIMTILNSGGALDHYTALIEELGRTEAKVEGLRHQLETAEKIETNKANIDIKRATIVKALHDDLLERSEIVRDAVLSFENLSVSLYEKAGSLAIVDTNTGPNFKIHIDGQRSKGITNMQIFCFDLMLTEIGMKNSRCPGFLSHDSHLFDGVDERQVAKALKLGAERAKTTGFQYIVTINSDSLPKDRLLPDFDVICHIIDMKLSEKNETGGLFGLLF